jgi:tetraacyldisaccharide 4'-kinase
VLLRIASSIYGAVAVWRRQGYERNPAWRRRLRQPVISVGNLSVGGSGKTPVVAHLARLLVEQGERPCILSRGYGRRTARRRVTVVSDGTAVLADLDASGDEPLMLARALPGVPVIVGPSRFRAGQVAEERFAVTVHLLDDGFQHVQLARDIDLLVTNEHDLSDTLLPAGRLREPLAMAARADAALVDAGYDEAAERVGRALALKTVFRVERAIGPPRLIATGETVVVPDDERVFAVAGIARPERFFADLSSIGWKVAGTMSFRDHHRFTDRDVADMLAEARSAAASIVMTTDKDAARLTGRDFGGVPVAAVPLTIGIGTAAAFPDWIRRRLQAARSGSTAPDPGHPARTSHRPL